MLCHHFHHIPVTGISNRTFSDDCAVAMLHIFPSKCISVYIPCFALLGVMCFVKHYKFCVHCNSVYCTVLACGVYVTGEVDGGRREAVKRKTAQYLQRAEQLVARLTRKEKKQSQVNKERLQ